MSQPSATDLQQLADGGPGLRYACATAQGVEPAFAVRFGGHVHAWINRCPHRGTELDWLPGEFFDDDARLLVCATHGALFEPHTGLCVAGPCKGQHLQRAPLAPAVPHANDGTATP